MRVRLLPWESPSTRILYGNKNLLYRQPTLKQVYAVKEYRFIPDSKVKQALTSERAFICILSLVSHHKLNRFNCLPGCILTDL